MSDTPRTDAQTWINQYPEYHASATRYVSADFARQLERENAALREALTKADVIAEHTRFDERREWRTIECWVYPNDIIVQMDRAAFDAAMQEANP